MVAVLYYEVSLTEVASLQKAFPWRRPSKCSNCGESPLWGHGFVYRYFNELSEVVCLKRWRCPFCSLIIICRPSAYWRYFRESIKVVFDALLARAKGARWPPDVPRQRGGHWLRRLLKHSRLHKLSKASLAETVTFYASKKLVFFQH